MASASPSPPTIQNMSKPRSASMESKRSEVELSAVVLSSVPMTWSSFVSTSGWWVAGGGKKRSFPATRHLFSVLTRSLRGTLRRQLIQQAKRRGDEQLSGAFGAAGADHFVVSLGVGRLTRDVADR